MRNQFPARCWWCTCPNARAGMGMHVSSVLGMALSLLKCILLLLVLCSASSHWGMQSTAEVDANEPQPERVRVHTAVVRVVCLDTRYVKYKTPPGTNFRAEFLDDGEGANTERCVYYMESQQFHCVSPLCPCSGETRLLIRTKLAQGGVLSHYPGVVISSPGW